MPTNIANRVYWNPTKYPVVYSENNFLKGSFLFEEKRTTINYKLCAIPTINALEALKTTPYLVSPYNEKLLETSLYSKRQNE